MPDQTNPHKQENDADSHDAHTKKEDFVYGVERKPEEYSPKDGKDTPTQYPKPSFTVRFLHFLWRRRKWRHIRKLQHPGPNWAEITTVCITLGIVVVTGIQAFIYWKQAEIMRESVAQNDRSIMLGSGQLVVAARNAKIATDAFNSSNDSFIKTFAQMQAQTGEAKRMADEAKRSADIAYRAWAFEHTAKLKVAMGMIDLGKPNPQAVLQASPFLGEASQIEVYAIFESSNKPPSPKTYDVGASQVSTYTCDLKKASRENCVKALLVPRKDPYPLFHSGTNRLYIRGKINFYNGRSKQEFTFCTYISRQDYIAQTGGNDVPDPDPNKENPLFSHDCSERE